MKQGNGQNEAFEKPVWMMTGSEFSEMLRQTISDSLIQHHLGHRKVAHGLNELKEYLGCGKTRLVELGKLGILDEAIISSVGKQKLYDVDKALSAVSKYMKIFSKK